MSAPLNSREPRNAKKKAMENAGKVPRTKTDPPAPNSTTKTKVHSDSSAKNLSSKLKRQRTFVDDPEEVSGDESDGSHADLQPVKPRALFESDSDSDHPKEDIANGNDSDADREESEGEEAEATAMMLSDEVPSLVSNKSKQVVQSRGKSQSAREAKQAAEIPAWRDFDNAVSESVDETTTACGESSEAYSSDVERAQKLNSGRTRSAQSIASLIRTEKGHIKLLDQNNETQQVVRDAIIDAKGYIIFVDAYPELVDKNQVSLQSLLTVARNRGIHAIKERLQTDAMYAAHLASLVEPRIPLLRRDLKVAACTNIDSYFRLGNNLVKAKKLMEQHAYIYALRFDSNNDASPIGKKPYQGDLLIFLIYQEVFSGAKSIGIRCSERFVELANNKGNRPEIPIPLLALVATAVYAALFWKTLGSPTKFSFTGNQFSETYVFHTKFLEDLKRDAPGKFHCMMADIYEAVQTLRQNGNEHIANEHQAALGLLDLDGMAED
ncbi:hypothetical protein EV424DRAFT_1349549 [Suillus variegatus]|nr:hypothetical protein EV424DRAFT_1349549 [Suillus variegatus]